MILYAYAKINLRLEVLGKRNDNYHELQMLNAKSKLYDILEINEDIENKVEFSKKELNDIPNNFCLNILNDMCDIYHINKRYHIYITKNIPDGAGLGGGSSDAASIIRFLNNDNNLGLNDNMLIEIGKKYGADIPYCLFNGIAIVEGIGEKINLIKDINLPNIYIICPNVHVSTKDVFNNTTIYDKKTKKEEILKYLENQDYKHLLYNGLENATFKLHKELKELKEKSLLYGDVVMSGSGSSFILIPNKNVDKKELEKEFTNCKIYE